ncbi:MAG: hypothetical protein QNJ72_42290 [Pleurocapsa sp. MO_226.B13]|nr:hypothetical protein [Pleurocapsa sp. MO_226.B13]
MLRSHFFLAIALLQKLVHLLIVGIGFGDEIDDIVEDPDSGFAFQIKAGAGLPLSESFDVFGQIRYVNAFDIYPEQDGDDGNLSTVGLEAGLNFKL